MPFVNPWDILIPPLRERREDIAILAHHFLKKYAAAAEKSIHAIFTNALQALTQHDFPGNVRELENTIESAVLFETTDLLQRQSLPLHLAQGDSQAATGGLIPPLFFRLTKLNGEPSSTRSQ